MNWWKKFFTPAQDSGYRIVSFLVIAFFSGKTAVSALYTLGILAFADPSQGAFEDKVFLGYFPYSLQALTLFGYMVTLAVITRFISIFIIAQFVLPVSRWEERWKARNSFNAFIKGKQALAVFIKEGKIIESPGETEDADGGVVLVDLSSAVSLSQQKDTEAWNIVDEGMDEEGYRRSFIEKLWKKKKQTQFVDVKGPGVAFLDAGQKISSAIDLRPQSRRMEVAAYTRNGIQITAQVSVTFSLSGDPETICVGYVGVSGGMEWSWLIFDEDSVSETLTLREVHELDPHDIPILEAYARNVTGSYAAPETSLSALDTPYKFYKDRVFNAASSKARSIATGKIIPWHESPLETAADLFRNELLAIPYDDLYMSSGGNKNDTQDTARQIIHVLTKLKDTFTRKMKLKGIVLFQYCVRRDGVPFQPGDVLPSQEVLRYPPISLTHHNFNSLRSLGVTIKSAGFTNIQPSNKDIKNRIVENWKAKWNKEVSFINAEHELESVRIQNRNRAQIQQEMTYLLSSIFQSSHTDEALALRVFQALETAAAHHGTDNDMTSREVVDMLDSLHRWLLIDRKDLQADRDDSGRNGSGKEGNNPGKMDDHHE